MLSASAEYCPRTARCGGGRAAGAAPTSGHVAVPARKDFSIPSDEQARSSVARDKHLSVASLRRPLVLQDVSDDSWADRNWEKQTYAHYKVQPYW